MKKNLSLILALMLLMITASALAQAPEYVNTESTFPVVKEDGPKVTLSLLTTRQTMANNNIEDVWFFKYLSKVANVNFELEQTLETNQRVSLMFASDTIPDIVWGIGLSNSDAMVYGSEEGMLLDWTPYMTPELMPNLCKAREDYPEAFAAATLPDGKTYALPCITGSSYYANTGAFSCTIRMYVNQKWLEACNLEKPTTLDEYLNMLRVFKEKDPMGLGENNIPLIGNQNKDKEYVWNALGFLGTATQAYGTEFAIKNNEVVLPCYTEEARTFIEFYHALFTEGLISPDYFTLDQTTARGLMASGYCGVLGDSSLFSIDDKYADWIALDLLVSDVNDTAVASIRPGYSTGMLYCSANTQYPEVVARLVDYLYSDDGALMYFFGPIKGSEHTDDVVTGWYLDGKGQLTMDKVENGEMTDTVGYAYQYIKPTLDVAGRFDHYGSQIYVTAGVPDNTTEYITITDKLTGKTLNSLSMVKYTDDNNDGHWRLTQAGTLVDNLTEIRLPGVYLSSEQNRRVADLRTVINAYVTTEVPKFITGARSLDELNNYFDELKKLGIEEYVDIYRSAYANYIESLK